MRIERVVAREVFDSRGRPTVEVDVTCAGARTGRVLVPSGASTGRHEACELRDGGPRLDGLGVRQAVRNVREVIGPAVVGRDATNQGEIDCLLCGLDSSSQKSRLGANAILGVSLAVAHAAAEARGVTLVQHLYDLWRAVPSRPVNSRLSGCPAALGTKMVMPLPMVNMISGGLHAGRNVDFQDFLIVPVGADSYSEALDWIVTVYRRLGQVLLKRGLEGVLVGDEGGYGPKLASNRQAVELVIEAIEQAGLRPGNDVGIALDVAATHFWDGDKYTLAGEGDRVLTAEGMAELLAGWVREFPIISIEDAVADDDWDGWRIVTQKLGDKVQLVGDDLFVTNTERLQRGISERVANSVLIKVNQIGTLSETFATLRLALDSGYVPVVSARSGETEDATLSDLAVAVGAGQIKIGSVARSERLAKYNQLLRLEESLGESAPWLGRAGLR